MLTNGDKMDKDYARVILSSWLQGEHTEDADIISVAEFPDQFKAIAKDIKNGLPLDVLVKAHGTKQISEIITSYRPAVYKAVVANLLKAEMLRTIPANANPNDLIQHAEKFTRHWQDRADPMDIATDYWAELSDRMQRESVHTGIALLDNKTDGIRPGGLTIIGARPSVGKSAFTLQVAVNVAKKGKKVLFIPLEMTGAEIVDRIVLRFGKAITPHAIRTGRMTDTERNSVNDVLEQLYALKDKFKVYEGVRQIEQIRALIEDERPDLVVIDQLSQVQTNDERTTIRERYVEITRELKAIAIKQKTAIWLPCQMNRESSKTGAVTMDYLKESGSIEEDADVVIILSNVKDDEGKHALTESGRVVKIEIAKNRQGEAGEDKLEFIGQRFLFRNLEQVDGFEEVITNVPF